VVIEVAASVDLRDVERGIDAMANPRAVTKGLRDIKAPLRADQREHAKKNEGPDGGWAPRKAKSRRRLLGRLPGAVKVTMTSTSVSAVSSVRWSGAHQDGAVVGRGVRLPARPFLWASEGLQTRAAELLRDAVAGEW
jgi:phage gpG-like protein